MGRMHLPVLVAALAAGLSAAQQLDLTNVAVDPDGWEFVDVSRPPLDTIRGGEFGTALAIDDTSSFPLVSAPIPVEGSGVDSGSVHGAPTLGGGGGQSSMPPCLLLFSSSLPVCLLYVLT